MELWVGVRGGDGHPLYLEQGGQCRDRGRQGGRRSTQRLVFIRGWRRGRRQEEGRVVGRRRVGRYEGLVVDLTYAHKGVRCLALGSFRWCGHALILARRRVCAQHIGYRPADGCAHGPGPSASACWILSGLWRPLESFHGCFPCPVLRLGPSYWSSMTCRGSL